MGTEQSEFIKWAWEVLLMLKLHPNQVITTSMHTLIPTQTTVSVFSECFELK